MKRRSLRMGDSVRRIVGATLALLVSCQEPRPDVSTAPLVPGGAARKLSDQAESDRDWNRPRIGNRPLAIALFPIQVVPDVLANAVVALNPGNLWPIQYLLYPFSVPYWGITDAWEGRPFWDPSALYE